jgi:uncharacterized protein (DUF58 family)
METKELLKKVRTIEIKTRGLSRQIFAGEYHSAFKGKGMAFSEVREYQVGDPIKNIDWHVTARFNHPYIKIFVELPNVGMVKMKDPESNNTLLVDTSEKKTRALYRQHYNAFRQKSIEHFRKSGVDFAELKTNVDYVKPLIALFKRR